MSTTRLFNSSTVGGLDGSATDPVEVFSDFGDETCGEPETAQHLILDFTPDPVIDNAISQKKICDFFNLINNMPDIQNLKIKPKKCEKLAKTEGAHTGSACPTRFKQKTKENDVDMTNTACSMLEAVGDKDMISRAFEGRMPGTVCSLSFPKEEEDIQQKKKEKRGHFCNCSTKPCKNCPGKKPAPSPLKQLCTKLEQWDAQHPKSMEPPGHAPAIQHCTLQRQVFEC